MARPEGLTHHDSLEELDDMPKAYTTWTVHPHDPIEELDERLWRVKGKVPGMDLMRVMTVAKRQDDSLVIHNAIALEDDAMARLEAWGEPRFIVVPNGYHRLDAPVFADRYPDAKVVCPSGGRAKVGEVVSVDMTYEEFPSDAQGELRTLDGVGAQEGVMTVHGTDGTTLVLNDALFNTPHGKGVAGFIFRYLTQSTGGPRVSRIFRWFVMKDRDALRAEFERLADTPNLKRIIVSHHQVIDDDPARVLREVAATL